MTTRNIIIAILIGAILVSLLAFFFRDALFRTNSATSSGMSQSSSRALISGTLDINGVTQGDTITLLQREYKQGTTFQSFAKNLPVADGGTWEFDGAKPGVDYEIQAQLVQDGKVVAESSPLTVTAPATDEVITINAEVAGEAGTVGNAVISGNIKLNGYVPPGSSIVVEGRRFGAQDFTVIASNLPATNNQFMSYTTAIPGQIYEVLGYLYNSAGNQIGVSSLLTIAAPASNEVLTINSSATPPVTPTSTPQSGSTATPVPQQGSVSISGSINFNGQAPANSRIVLFQRQSNSQNYVVAQNNIVPQNGSTWSFTTAASGQWYNLVAILKQHNANGTDTDIADSNTLTVAAPATNQTLTINSGFSLPQPSGSITVSCGNLSSGNQTWGATISFQTVQNAQTYWYQLGSTSGGSDLQNVTQSAASNVSAQSISQTLNNDVTYYARYAYSEIPNQGTYSSQFSPFSNVTPVRCP